MEEKWIDSWLMPEPGLFILTLFNFILIIMNIILVIFIVAVVLKNRK